MAPYHMDQAEGCFLMVGKKQFANFKQSTDGRPYREAVGRENHIAIVSGVR